MFYTLHPAATSKGPNSQIRELEPFQGETRPQLWGWHILTSSPKDWVKETPKKNCRAWSSIGSKHHQSAEYLALKRVSILSMGSIMCVGVTTNLALIIYLSCLTKAPVRNKVSNHLQVLDISARIAHCSLRRTSAARKEKSDRCECPSVPCDVYPTLQSDFFERLWKTSKARQTTNMKYHEISTDSSYFISFTSESCRKGVSGPLAASNIMLWTCNSGNTVFLTRAAGCPWTLRFVQVEHGEPASAARAFPAHGVSGSSDSGVKKKNGLNVKINPTH